MIMVPNQLKKQTLVTDFKAQDQTNSNKLV
jgi:hypothetical protein